MSTWSRVQLFTYIGFTILLIPLTFILLECSKVNVTVKLFKWSLGTFSSEVRHEHTVIKLHLGK